MLWRTSGSSNSTPVARALYFWAAMMTMRPSPEPRSNIFSPGFRPPNCEHLVDDKLAESKIIRSQFLDRRALGLVLGVALSCSGSGSCESQSAQQGDGCVQRAAKKDRVFLLSGREMH